MIQRTPSRNGWKFWYAVKNDKALLIDDLRNEYIKEVSWRAVTLQVP